ncbi:uncharacterized protein LOC101746276 [Bombyx mori]|uniref:Uncharacterized protein n=1 Tax=Bombyx mori TaxID=7091 RepID=A0A8R2AKH1_BOMMO|nr:uncharacterized protein LOC101746276 [Bombyx mori]
MQSPILILLAACVSVRAIDGSDSKFMKDYAMLKIYESCFGSNLLKQITKELRDAYSKCSTTPSMKQTQNSLPSYLSNLAPGFAMDPTQSNVKHTDGAIQNDENDLPNQEAPQSQKVGGIFAFRPQGVPFPQPGMSPFMMPAGPQFRPYNPAMFQLPYQGYLPPGLPYNPYYPPYQFYQQQPYVGANRMSRQIGLRTRLGLHAPRSVNHNVTCVMQELGYVDDNMEPNFEHIRARIGSLPVSDELKGDIQEGLQFCQKFSQCVPEEKRDIVARPQEQIRSIFFFRCYKHKKLEACIMKDINEHFAKEYAFDHETPDFAYSRSGRSARDLPLRDPSLEALEEMEVYLYDYLSGGGAFDFDLYI